MYLAETAEKLWRFEHNVIFGIVYGPVGLRGLNSALDITKLFPPSEVSPSPTVDTHPVFDLEEITEAEVKNIILTPTL